MIKIPDSEYHSRIRRIQDEMERQSVDVLVVYSSECESANVRYIADFWPSFDFAGAIIPIEGEPALLTGGPESQVFADTFSRIKNILIHPGFVETSAPEWLPKTETTGFRDIIPLVCKHIEVKRVGVAGSNIFPHLLYEDLLKSVNAEIVNADDVMFNVRMFKSDIEVEVLRNAYGITEEAMKAAVDYVEIGKTEKEITAEALATMYRLGAEGTSYPVWVCTGTNTSQSLCRSTDRTIKRGELVQLTLGAKYQGYCGNLCRGLVVGDVPRDVRKLIEVALETEKTILDVMGPGIRGKEVYKVFSDILNKYGFKDLALYGPAHGTGLQECEGPWLDEKSEIILQPNMVFNVDIWLADAVHGLRYEDGIVITETGADELTSWRREIITK